MKHYNAAQWLRFLRGEQDHKSRVDMQQHLKLPCNKCSATLALLRRIAATAQKDTDLEPLKDAVREARSIPRWQPKKKRDKPRRPKKS